MRMLILSIAIATASSGFAADLPEGYWSREQIRPILEKTQTVVLDPDIIHLSDGERIAVERLLTAGQILQRVYEDARHPEALAARERLAALHHNEPTDRTRELLTLYRLFNGPIASTLENERLPFLPVHAQTPQRNVYPAGADKAEIDAWIETHPHDRAELLAERTVVRRSTAESLRQDLAVLDRYPVLDTLHPGLRDDLERRLSSPAGFHAIPQSVNWADELMEVYQLLNEAAAAAEGDDAEFARYLRNRSRDLLSDDYESGDASWITGEFRNLNAQIGSYETYDDPLYGVKAFHSLSLLTRNREATERLRKALGGGLQRFEDSLPYERHKQVRGDIPVGVYEVIADFGQSRGANTATILPNDPLFSKRYGRVILLRENIMRNPQLFANSRLGFDAVMDPAAHTDLSSEGDFYRTLWHEIGHYLGADRDIRGRTIDAALEENADSFEEMKADLVSLFVAPALRESGYFDEAALRSVYASGIKRVLQNTRPRRDQPYQTMQLMQFNWFLEHGVLQFDEDTGRLIIDYDVYPAAVREMLARVLEIQSSGDKAASDRFMEEWTTWGPMHERMAEAIRSSQKYRFTLMRYVALGESASKN